MKQVQPKFLQNLALNRNTFLQERFRLNFNLSVTLLVNEECNDILTYFSLFKL